MILKDTEWAGTGHEIEFIYFMRDTVQPEGCFSFNLRISDLLIQLQHLFVFLFLVRKRITKIKEDQQNIKEQTAEGCNTEHLLCKEKLRFELIKPIPQTLYTGTDFPGRSRGCNSHTSERVCFMSYDGLWNRKKRADTDPELLLFPQSTTTARAIFCYYESTLFSYTSLHFLLNKQVVTSTTHI